MKTKKITILFGALIILISSCKDYLDPWPNGNYDNENIWEYQNMVQGIINRCYDNIDAYSVGNSYRTYNDNEGAFLDGVTDDAVITSTANTLRRYAVNAMTSSNDPFATYWDRDYRTISQCNIFLKDGRGYNTRYMVKTTFNDQVRTRLQGEAYALRAFFEWDLLQKFGGKGTNGQMLGFPIITDVIDPYSDINYARDTFDDCVAQIIKDCDSALYYLPLAYRDFLYPGLSSSEMQYLGARYWNRFDDTGVWAIKATVYLTWASPRFNPTNDLARWDSAAKYAKKLVDFKLVTDNVASASASFRPTAKVDWFNPNSPEIVFSTRYITGQTYMERMFYPGGFQGNGELGATQEIVDAFGDNLGYPITHPSSNYDPLNPYANRDPRFYSVIFYNGAKANRLNDVAKPMYTFENWNVGVTAPGKDVAGARSDNSRTNYHIKKYIYMDVNWEDKSVKNAPHSKFIYRWAQFVLAFAEAANHVTGDPNVALYGMTPKAAIKYLRERNTYDNAVPGFKTTDPYLDEVVLAGEAAFDAFVKNERRIETCFEGMRFYDLRRWTTGDAPGEGNWEAVINQPVHGAYITETAPGTYTYDLGWEVETRAVPSPYNPIPYYEMLRMDKLVQNVGWPTWN
ncbi:MAG: RagB/SusD family nutrient uptake outer membrane protein [Bacteroidales bacterium]|nr:RagB/SusD family nutrient uptake outer membrane protein [Bacteroidales bacterium]